MLKPTTIPFESLERAADCLRVMSHPMRLRMADLLGGGELPVHEVADACGLPPHQACEHLRLLKGYGLLESERRGRSVYYRLADERLSRLLEYVKENCRDRLY